MALISIPNIFTVGQTIVASAHNSNFSTIYNQFNGLIDTTNISPTAAIADTQLAQISTASKISGAALTLLGSIPASGGAIPSKNGGTGSDLSAATIGADPYFSATGVISALAAGTSGQVKVSQGAGAPIWANALSSVSDYGTSASASTARQATAIKVCYGTIASVTGGSSTTISNLPYTSSSSFVIIVCETGGSGSDENRGSMGGTPASASTATIYNTDNANHGVNWITIGI